MLGWTSQCDNLAGDWIDRQPDVWQTSEQRLEDLQHLGRIRLGNRVGHQLRLFERSQGRSLAYLRLAIKHRYDFFQLSNQVPLARREQP